MSVQAVCDDWDTNDMTQTSPLRALRTLSLVSFIALLAGCGSTAIVLDGRIPVNAAIVPIDLTAGIYLDPNMLAHIHTEEIQSHGDWTIATGAAHQQMWGRLVPSMFARAVTTGSTTAPESGADLIIAPRLEEFQFAIPGQTRNTFYEVWLRYRVAVHNPNDGQVIVEFPHVAYGKSVNKTFERDGDGVLEAANWAFRDAGAFFVKDFSARPEVRSWLEARLAGEPMPEASEDAAAGEGE